MSNQKIEKRKILGTGQLGLTIMEQLSEGAHYT